MYKNVFSEKYEDCVSYGTAEDKIGYKGKAIGAGIAIAGSLGLGYVLITTDMDMNGSADWYEIMCPNSLYNGPWGVLFKSCAHRWQAEKIGDILDGLK